MGKRTEVALGTQRYKVIRNIHGNLTLRLPRLTFWMQACSLTILGEHSVALQFWTAHVFPVPEFLLLSSTRREFTLKVWWIAFLRARKNNAKWFSKLKMQSRLVGHRLETPRSSLSVITSPWVICDCALPTNRQWKRAEALYGPRNLH